MSSHKPIPMTESERSPASPQEWKLVPVEPTDEQISAMTHVEACHYFPLKLCAENRRKQYRAAIASAPASPPAPPSPAGREEIKLPAALDWHTGRLVIEFAEAVAQKLRRAEEKYGYSDGWNRDDWEAECRKHLYEHLAKGDPRDVAAYCAFMWHHKWSTSAAPSSNGVSEPFLPADMDGLSSDDWSVDPTWNIKALKCLAQQLGVGNDFYYPLIGSAELLAASPPSNGMREALENYGTGNTAGSQSATRLPETLEPGRSLYRMGIESAAKALGPETEIREIEWHQFYAPRTMTVKEAVNLILALPPAPVGGEDKIPENRVVGSEQWRPIETAPKDGEAVLVIRSGKESDPSYNVVYWDENNKEFPWKFVDGNEAYHNDWPTHWMPLPAPPPSNDGPRSGEGE